MLIAQDGSGPEEDLVDGDVTLLWEVSDASLNNLIWRITVFGVCRVAGCPS